MATRKDIREAFKTALDTAVPSSGSDGHVPSDSITIERPESDEDLPSVVYNDAWRKRPINQASTAPTRVARDQSGAATEEFYATLHEGRFDLLFWFTDEEEKEACYEAVRTYFEKYEHAAWDASDLQEDVEWVRVRDAQSDDDTDVNPVRHGDRLLVSLVFTREYGDTDDAIEQVDTEVDADDDGVIDASWSTT